MRVLIIEDDPHVGQTLSDTLELNGFNVELATDGIAGWDAAKRETPAIILTDVAMPGLTGLQLLERFRADPELRVVPAIVISACDERENIRRGMGLGAADYIPKPFTEEEVISAVTAQLSKKARYDEMDAFSHTVAHDLRAPLTTLYCYLDILRAELEGNPNPALLGHATTALQSAQRLNSIIDDVLTLAGVRHDAVVPQVIDMAAVVKESSERLDAVFRSRGATLNLPATWPAALGHAPWVALIWTNLLSNAAKYGGNTPSLELGGECSEDGNFVRFWVRDHGAGITETDQRKIFTPRAHVSAQRIDSHGLGLSIVRRVVEHLGGCCGGERLTDGGSRFWFDLPAAKTSPRSP